MQWMATEKIPMDAANLLTAEEKFWTGDAKHSNGRGRNKILNDDANRSNG